jgi:hypothetical protein
LPRSRAIPGTRDEYGGSGGLLAVTAIGEAATALAIDVPRLQWLPNLLGEDHSVIEPVAREGATTLGETLRAYFAS